MSAADSFTPKSDFLRIMLERGYVHQCSDFAGLDEKAAARRARRPISASTAPRRRCMSAAGADHDAALAAADRRQAGRADGRRHHEGRRSVRQGRERASCSRSSRSRPTRPASSTVFSRFLSFGDGHDRRDHARQRRVAGEAQLHRLPARRRPAFLGQPHAVDGFGEACGWSASRSSRSSNSTTCACRPTTSSSSTGATA